MKKLDLHGLDRQQAQEALENALGKLKSGEQLEIVNKHDSH